MSDGSKDLSAIYINQQQILEILRQAEARQKRFTKAEIHQHKQWGNSLFKRYHQEWIVKKRDKIDPQNDVRHFKKYETQLASQPFSK